MRRFFFIGLDLGKRRDYSAIVVAERRVMPGPWNPTLGGYPQVERLEMQWAERMPRGTSYVEVARRVAAIRQRLESMGGTVRLAVDATGVGVAVVEMLKAVGLGGIMTQVTVTGSGGLDRAVSGDGASDFVSVNKTALFYGLRVGMEQERTGFSAHMPLLKELKAELREIGVILGPKGTRVTGAKGERHDDLAFAAALVQFVARRVFPSDAARAERRAQGRLV